MPVIEIDVEVWCSCGEGLCNQSSVHRTGRGVVVEPCEKCLEKAVDDGYDKGYSKGCEETESKNI